MSLPNDSTTSLYTQSPRSVFAQSRFKKLLITLLSIAIFLGIMIVPVEWSAPNPQITNVFDGIYWAVTTITSVGYGDFVPVTQLGKVISIILQLIGVMVFGSLIGTIVIHLNRVQNEYHWQRVNLRLDKMEKDLESLKKYSEFIVKERGGHSASSQPTTQRRVFFISR